MLPKKETLTVEFKSDRKKYPDSEIFDAVVAFANTDGGDLYLGVEDSGEVTGVHKQHSNPVTLSAYIANNTIPPVSVRAEIIEDVYPVLKISVPKCYGGIVATVSGKVSRRQIKADGTPENVPMYPYEFATRLSDLRLLDYSAMLVDGASLDDLDAVETEHLRNLILSYNGEQSLLELPDEGLLKALGFVREVGGRLIPTITGLLMLGKTEAIRQHIPTHSASFQVLEGTLVRVNEDFCQPLLSTIVRIHDYMSTWNPEREIEMGLFRVSVPDFNRRAFREAIVNAFSHRDYTKMGRVRVALNEDGLTIANPGGFIEGVTIQNLLSAEPHGRNPLLADALKRIGLAEKTGRGIDRIFEGSLIYGNPLPDYNNSTSVAVSLFIPRSKPDPQLAKLIADEQNRLGRPLTLNTLLVLNLLKEMPRSSVGQLAEAMNLSEIAVKSILDTSVECSLVDAFGSGKNRTYILSSRAYNTKARKIGYVRQADIDEARYQELVVKIAKENEYIARGDVVQLLHIDNGKAYRLLKSLVDQHLLEQVNRGRYAKYRYCGDK